MVSWQEFERQAPSLAAALRARFEAHRHHVLASLRKDGSPRVSGTEVAFQDGELTLGSMPGAVKARDLQRDPRFAVHANPGDGSMAGGDAKAAGRAVEVGRSTGEHAEQRREPGAPEGAAGAPHIFRLDLEEAVLTTVEDGDHLLIRVWRPGGPVREIRRR